MTTTDWQRAIAVVLDYEGGNDDDPRDPGGRTSRGILQREWTAYVRESGRSDLPQDVFRAPQAAILDIYRRKYWNPVVGDSWPAGCDLTVFDAGVNSGIGRALEWSRAATPQGPGTFVSLAALWTARNDRQPFIRKFAAARLSFLHRLRTWRFFGRGWARRVAGIEAISTRWALADSGASAAAIRQSLTLESAHSQVRVRQAQTGTPVATGTGGAAAGFGTWTDHMTVLEWALIACAVSIALAWLAYLAHEWYTQAVRADAFKREARNP